MANHSLPSNCLIMNGNLATTGVLQSINVKPDSLSKNSSSISKRQVNQLLDFRFIDQRDNLIFIGPLGVGKTHLAISTVIQSGNTRWVWSLRPGIRALSSSSKDTSSGNGHDRFKFLTRVTISLTVERPMLSVKAICRWVR